MESQIAAKRQWQSLLGIWGVDPAKIDGAFADLVSRYAEPSRYYHNLGHIQKVLETIENLGAASTRPNAVRLAAWLHDIVYDSKASDNEERSADSAMQLCQQLSIPDAEVVASLILATKTHNAAGNPDAQVLLDADLAILGAPAPEYRDYAACIRKEYAWVPKADYRAGRRSVLESFIARPRIYYLLRQLEEPARRNLADELTDLAD